MAQARERRHNLAAWDLARLLGALGHLSYSPRIQVLADLVAGGWMGTGIGPSADWVGPNCQSFAGTASEGGAKCRSVKLHCKAALTAKSSCACALHACLYLRLCFTCWPSRTYPEHHLTFVPAAALEPHLVGAKSAREVTAAVAGLVRLGADPGPSFAAACMAVVRADGGRDQSLLSHLAWGLAAFKVWRVLGCRAVAECVMSRLQGLD